MQILRPATDFFSDALRTNRKFLVALALGVCFVSYAIVLFKNTCFVGGGADSAGYLSSGRLFSRGEISQSESELNELGLSDDWTNVFVPLGFLPGTRPRTLVPTYPPGVPLHMAVATWIGGPNGPFLVSPIAGLFCLVLIYALAREFQLSVQTSLAASVILALCPTFIFQAMQPMSDVIATLWCLVTIYVCLRSDRAVMFAVAAGAAFGVAVLVRPNNLLLLAPIVFALPLKPKHLLLFIAGGLPFGAFFLWYNGITYGAPMRTGYGSIVDGGLLAWSNFLPRFKHYAYQSLWQLSPLVPIGWLAVTVKPAIPLRRRLLLLVWPGVYLGFYSFYFPYDTWWYFRFLLPALPAVVVGALLVWEDQARELSRRHGKVISLIGALLLLVTICTQLYQVAIYNVLGMDEIQSGEYVETSAGAIRILPSRSFIVCMQTSGALRYYTEFRIVRWDVIDKDKSEKLLTLLKERRQDLYALLFPFELEEAQRRINGTWTKMVDIRGITLWSIKLGPETQTPDRQGREVMGSLVKEVAETAH